MGQRRYKNQQYLPETRIESIDRRFVFSAEPSLKTIFLPQDVEVQD